MSTVTVVPAAAALAARARNDSSAKASSRPSPSWVSFTEMLASRLSAAMRSMASK